MDALTEGLNFKTAAAMIHKSTTQAYKLMKDYEPYVSYKQHKSEYVKEESDLPEWMLTVKDAEYFKEVVSVGEDLYFDYTEYGIPVAGTLIAKYEFQGLIQDGMWVTGVNWNWLLLMNRKRIGL